MPSFIQQENQKEFLYALVLAVTGKPINEYPSEEVAGIITKCYDFMISWIVGKSEPKHPEFSAVLKSKQDFSLADENLFHHYYQEFLVFLQQNKSKKTR